MSFFIINILERLRGPSVKESTCVLSATMWCKDRGHFTFLLKQYFFCQIKSKDACASCSWWQTPSGRGPKPGTSLWRWGVHGLVWPPPQRSSCPGRRGRTLCTVWLQMRQKVVVIMMTATHGFGLSNVLEIRYGRIVLLKYTLHTLPAVIIEYMII